MPQLVRNQKDRLLAHTQEKLGLYVYVLVDPRTSEVFYVGKGGGSVKGTGNQRVLHHFRDAKKYVTCDAARPAPSRKVIRILEIWNCDQDVQWWIIRRGIKHQEICDQIEAALIDAFSLTLVMTLNEKRGYGSRESGLISSQDVRLLNPPPVNPLHAHKLVFLFPISQLIGERNDLYESTRKYWRVPERWRDQEGAIALGINSQTSAAAFYVNAWQIAGGKYAFTGDDVTDNNELARRDFTSIIDRAKGYWQHGQFLIIEFGGNGNFRFHRGSKDKEWHRLP